jgi:hypothetical protein
MAKDMVCKLCEAAPEQEVGIMLISDLTGSGQLPFAIGPRCIEAWLTEMLEVFALPEGIPPSEPSELDDSIVGDDDVVSFPGDAYDRAQTGDEPDLATETALAAQEGRVIDIDVVLPYPVIEDPTAILEPSGPSPAESSAPSTGNGRRGARKLTDPVNIPTA